MLDTNRGRPFVELLGIMLDVRNNGAAFFMGACILLLLHKTVDFQKPKIILLLWIHVDVERDDHKHVAE